MMFVRLLFLALVVLAGLAFALGYNDIVRYRKMRAM
jgi:hypothetical protein